MNPTTIGVSAQRVPTRDEPIAANLARLHDLYLDGLGGSGRLAAGGMTVARARLRHEACRAAGLPLAAKPTGAS